MIGAFIVGAMLGMVLAQWAHRDTAAQLAEWKRAYLEEVQKGLDS